MDTVIFLLFLFFSTAGLVLHIAGLPGNFIILFFALLFSWYGSFEVVSFSVLSVLAVLAISGELADFFLGVIGAKKYKASNRAVVASIMFAFVGAVWGAVFLFGFGSVIGAFAGAFAGAFLVEYLKGGNLQHALRSAWGTLLGRVGGTIFKTAIGMAMIAIVVFSYINY